MTRRLSSGCCVVGRRCAAATTPGRRASGCTGIWPSVGSTAYDPADAGGEGVERDRVLPALRQVLPIIASRSPQSASNAAGASAARGAVTGERQPCRRLMEECAPASSQSIPATSSSTASIRPASARWPKWASTQNLTIWRAANEPHREQQPARRRCASQCSRPSVSDLRSRTLPHGIRGSGWATPYSSTGTALGGAVRTRTARTVEGHH